MLRSRAAGPVLASTLRRAETLGRWQHFSHIADIGLQGDGATLAEAFEQAALALTAVVADPATVQPQRAVEVKIDCPATERELLLVDWLNAWIYEMATRQMLFCRFEARFDAGVLHGIGWGEPVDRTRHRPAVEVKAATYTELAVWQGADALWHVRCVVDV